MAVSFPKEVVCHILSTAANTTTDALKFALVSKEWSSVVFSSATSDMWKHIAYHPKSEGISGVSLHNMFRFFSSSYFGLSVLPSLPAPRIKNWYSFIKARHLATVDLQKDKFHDEVHPIENCGLTFPRMGEFGVVNEKEFPVEWELKCPILWENLQNSLTRGGTFSVRPNELTCTVCSHQVRWVYSNGDLDRAIKDGVCVIYDVNEEDPELHRKIGKCRQPTEAEIKKRKEDNKKINKRAEQRITNKKHWKF